ncbi:MAG: DNA topoisomerase 4 subunit A [Lachnospiraceae bacterium]|nr:DNA topoisomerase 4 subunit A [Lachnospiraceae bacterium]
MPERILTTDYSEEMQQSYINYSMSVITSRAVPDIRDGLKPVQRRVLYAMSTLGLNADKPHKKSARIVGDTMGKFHPHGDSSIYEALVVLSQDFKKGMALVDGHGNFGSIEGDGAAAMRYTEARLKKFTQEVYLKDLDKNVVDFVPNYDETDKEPEVLPVRIPNFLVNGSEGIAVGMTTSTPPHNLQEVLDAFILYLDKPEASTEEYLAVMPGPDFPTGGIVINQSELKEIYETGKGKIKIRGRAEFIPAKKRGEKDRIEVTEIPYTMLGANIGKFLSDVAELAEKKVFPDITDISNQSGKDGIRIVIELKSGADGEKILSGLYKKTKLEDTFGVNMLAIVNGRPEILSLKRIFEETLKFQLEINKRKYTTLLEKESERKEIQEGLIRAVDVIDLIIEIIRGSKKLEQAKNCLVYGDVSEIKFKSEQSKEQAQNLHFSEIQAQAILDLRLAKLIGLEILALQKEHEETLKKIRLYKKLLSSKAEMKAHLREELEEIRDQYKLERKTVITEEEEGVFEEQVYIPVPATFTMNRFGYVKVYELPVFEKNQDAIREESKTLISCMSDSRIVLFTDNGFMYTIRLRDLPFSKVKDKGVPIENLTSYDSSKDQILKIDSFESIKDKLLLFVTSNGMIKKVESSEFDSVKKMIASTKLADEDRLVYVGEVFGTETVLVSEAKTVLRFRNDDIPTLKKTSVGVRGMKLADGDRIIQVYDFDPSVKYVVKVGTRRVNLAELKLKKRDAKPELIR